MTTELRGTSLKFVIGLIIYFAIMGIFFCFQSKLVEFTAGDMLVHPIISLAKLNTISIITFVVCICLGVIFFEVE